MRKAPITARTARSGPGCPAFSTRWRICHLELDGAGCSVPCTRILIRIRKYLQANLPFVQSPPRPYPFLHESAKLPSEMNKLQKWWKRALAIAVILIALQAGVSFLARTHRVHAYLVGQLERAFGRQ